jgi:hypothetical protein
MKSVRGYFVASLLVVAWMCPPAMAQGTADKPTPKVGDKWEFQQSVKAAPDGDSSQPWSRMVAEALPDQITLVGGNNQPLQYDASLNFIAKRSSDFTAVTRGYTSAGTTSEARLSELTKFTPGK